MLRFHRITRPASRLMLIAAASLVMTAGDCDDDDDNDDGGMMMPPPQPATFTQVDRFGLPAINTVFIPSDTKQTYNESQPSNDPANFTDEAAATLAAFGITGQDAADLAAFVFPDVQPINTSMSTGFPNGRAPADDVIDGELMLIFGDNADLNSDNVDANDVAFLNTFPYLAPPN